MGQQLLFVPTNTGERPKVTTEQRDRSPAGRFIYLAEKRVSKAINALESIEKLSEKKNYSYTEDQVQQIITALEAALDNVKTKFSNEQEKRSREFKLK